MYNTLFILKLSVIGCYLINSQSPYGYWLDNRYTICSRIKSCKHYDSANKGRFGKPRGYYLGDQLPWTNRG